MESQTAAQPKAICPSNFFKVGGIKSGHTVFITTSDIIYTSHLRGWGIAGILTFLYAKPGYISSTAGTFLWAKPCRKPCSKPADKCETMSAGLGMVLKTPQFHKTTETMLNSNMALKPRCVPTIPGPIEQRVQMTGAYNTK